MRASLSLFGPRWPRGQSEGPGWAVGAHASPGACANYSIAHYSISLSFLSNIVAS